MNSKVLSDQQQKQPKWLLVLVTIMLLLLLISAGSFAYKKWIIEPNQKVNQSSAASEQQLILKQDDVIDTNWLRTLDPLVDNTEGRVVWSNILQRGVMEFIDLPKLPKNQRYQLWIYDVIGKDSKPIFSTEFSDVSNKKLLIPFRATELILSPFKFELLLKTEGKELTQPLFLAQP